MTTSIIPQWDLTDRLHKSMRTAGYTVTDMSKYFGVHRNTVSGWLHGRINPDTRTLRLWALATNVPYEWLITGSDQPLLLPRLDSNQQPFDCTVTPLLISHVEDCTLAA